MREKQINEFNFNRMEKFYTGLISDVLDDFWMNLAKNLRKYFRRRFRVKEKD